MCAKGELDDSLLSRDIEQSLYSERPVTRQAPLGCADSGGTQFIKTRRSKTAVLGTKAQLKRLPAASRAISFARHLHRLRIGGEARTVRASSLGASPAAGGGCAQVDQHQAHTIAATATQQAPSLTVAEASWPHSQGSCLSRAWQCETMQDRGSRGWGWGWRRALARTLGSLMWRLQGQQLRRQLHLPPHRLQQRRRPLLRQSRCPALPLPQRSLTRGRRRRRRRS